MLTAPVVGLDPGTATVVVQPPGLDLSVVEASRIGLMPGAPSARYPLRALFAPTEEGEPGRIARASGLLAALRMVLPDVDGPLAATSESFLRLAEVLARVPIYGTGLPEDARGLLGHCLRLVAMTEDPALNVAGS